MLPTLAGVKEINPFWLVLEIYNKTEDVYMRGAIYSLLVDCKRGCFKIESATSNPDDDFFIVEIRTLGNRILERRFETDAFKNNLVTFKN